MQIWGAILKGTEKRKGYLIPCQEFIDRTQISLEIPLTTELNCL